MVAKIVFSFGYNKITCKCIYNVIQPLIITSDYNGNIIDITYFMDNNGDCSKGVINLNYGRKVTAKGKSSILFSTLTSGSCTITFRSDNGFIIDFDEGEITNCGVTLSLYSGTSTSASPFVSS